MAEQVVTKAQIVADLRKLGLETGDIVLVHSSLSSIGRVEGGAAAVIEALLEVLTRAGTLVMPAFNWSRPYDPDLPSVVGVIPETFRQRPDVVHGFHPTHPVTALGARAADLVADHLKSPTACGRDTPFGRLITLGGKILLLGVDHDRSTTMHTLEAYAQAPYLSDVEASYYDAEGKVQTIKLTLQPGPHRDFIGLDPLFQKEGVEGVGKVGRARSRLVDARKMHDVMLAAFRDDPALVLCDNPNCDACVMQRRKIRLARLQQEAFRLSALASSVSSYPDEIAYELNRAGIYDLVLDRLYGQPVWAVREARLTRAVATFASEGLAVGAVHVPADLSALDHSLDLVAAAGAKAAIAAFPPDPIPFLEAAAQRGLEMLFENTSFPSALCLQLLASAPACPMVAFNPAAFALVGEKPFLDIINHGPFRRYVGLLYLSDATFGGEYTLPGRGHGEVKELLSIFRCRSFSGRVVVATGPGGPGFRELVEGFWRLMDSS